MQRTKQSLAGPTGRLRISRHQYKLQTPPAASRSPAVIKLLSICRSALLRLSLASGHAMQPQAAPAEGIAPQGRPSRDIATAAAAAAVPCNNGDDGGASAAATPHAPTQPQPVQAPQCTPQKRKAPAAATVTTAAPAQQQCKPAAAAGAAIAAPATPPQHAPAVHVALPSDMANFKHPPWMPKAGLLKLFGDFFWQYTPQVVDLCPEGVDTWAMTVPANTGLQVERNSTITVMGILTSEPQLHTV